MNDGTPHEGDREQTGRAAYALGYADGRLLLRGVAQRGEALGASRARYLVHLSRAQPTAVELAYLAGLRDAAADNLPRLPQEIEPTRRAA